MKLLLDFTVFWLVFEIILLSFEQMNGLNSVLRQSREVEYERTFCGRLVAFKENLDAAKSYLKKSGKISELEYLSLEQFYDEWLEAWRSEGDFCESYEEKLEIYWEQNPSLNPGYPNIRVRLSR